MDGFSKMFEIPERSAVNRVIIRVNSNEKRESCAFKSFC